MAFATGGGHKGLIGTVYTPYICYVFGLLPLKTHNICFGTYNNINCREFGGAKEYYLIWIPVKKLAELIKNYTNPLVYSIINFDIFYLFYNFFRC